MDLAMQLLVGLSVVVSGCALVLAGYSILRAEVPRLLALEKRCAELEIEVAGLANAYQQTRDTLKRINSRYVMREKRAKSNGQDPDMPDPQTDPDGWREAMMRKYPRGVFDYGK